MPVALFELTCVVLSVRVGVGWPCSGLKNFLRTPFGMVPGPCMGDFLAKFYIYTPKLDLTKAGKIDLHKNDQKWYFWVPLIVPIIVILKFLHQMKLYDVWVLSFTLISSHTLPYSARP